MCEVSAHRVDVQRAVLGERISWRPPMRNERAFFLRDIRVDLALLEQL